MDTIKRIDWLGRSTALALTALSLVACGQDDRRDRAANDPPVDVSRPAGLLTWMAGHPDKAGLALLPDRGESLDFGGERRFPLASTRKVLIVGALTGDEADLRTEIPRSAVERFYVPGTDGGAHERARLDRPRLTLHELAQASVTVSDNAAADALLHRVGADAVDAWARAQGMAGQDPILPVLGELAAWTRDSKWTERSPEQRARSARALAERVTPNEIRLPGLEQQRSLASHSVAGSPVEWAALMRRIGSRGDPRLIELLDWPRRQDAGVRQGFERYLTKGGSLPGVITEASYLRPRQGPGTAVAVFLRDLPDEIEATLARTFTHQRLIARLATDTAFRRRARQILAG